MATQIQTRRDTSANWASANPVLLEGEMGYETDTLKLKVGDGVTPYNALAYTISQETSAGLFEENATGGGATSTQRVNAGDASGSGSTLSGGGLGSASGFYSVNSGGFNNTSSGSYATVGGGRMNTASGNFSATVGGGTGNTASGNYYATVGGGTYNISSNAYSTVCGGYGNTSSGFKSIVGAGNQNVASSDYSSILGGRNNNTSTFSNSHIIGSNITSDRSNSTFVQNLSIKSVPTSAAGLPSGSVWSNAGVLNIVP